MRADVYLAEHNYVQSRQRARVLIENRCVKIDGITVLKPATPIDAGEHLVEIQEIIPYVGRGGLKLEAALDAFSICVKDLFAVDIGASTGGFTDCLLQRGASQVCAVDSGSGQLAKELLSDPRVVSLERKNARQLTAKDIGDRRADLIVMDVSFISATYILPRFPEILLPQGQAVCLIKPQFEVGKNLIGKGGIVKDRSAHRLAIMRVCEAGLAVGLTPVGLIASPVKGGDGNREFLVHFINARIPDRQISAETVRQVTM